MAPRTSPESPLLEAALTYAARGWRTFPCRPRGKEPLTEHGFHDASTDADQVRAWWARWPDANIGIATGSGLQVVDIDPDHGGYEWLDEAPLAMVPPTLTSRTGSGGQHRFYVVDPGLRIGNSAGKIAPGVDTRGDGGYVIVPPSVHPNGTPYAWSEYYGPDSYAPVPLAAELMAVLLGAPEPPPLELAATPTPELAGVLLVRALDRASRAGRNDTGLWLACQLRDNGFSEHEAARTMLDYQGRVPNTGHPYRSQEAMRSLRNAYSRPARQAWPEREREPPAPIKLYTGAPRLVPGPALPQADVAAPPPVAGSPTMLGDSVEAPAQVQELVVSLAQELAETRAALERERAARHEAEARLELRNAHIQWTHDLLRMPNVTAGVKLTLYFARWQIEWAGEQLARAGVTPDAPEKATPPVEVNITRLAQVSGQSAQVVGRNLQRAAALGLLDRDERRVSTPTGIRTQVMVQAPVEFLEAPSKLAPTGPDPYWREKVRCKVCGSANMRAAVYRCKDCGALTEAEEELTTAEMDERVRRLAVLESADPVEEALVIDTVRQGGLPDPVTGAGAVYGIAVPVRNGRENLRRETAGARCWACGELRPCGCEAEFLTGESSIDDG